MFTYCGVAAREGRAGEAYQAVTKIKVINPALLCRVDFFIPGVDKVGGFSMCSSPGLLQREGVVELAVKLANHPPAHWVHTAVSGLTRVSQL